MNTRSTGKKPGGRKMHPKLKRVRLNITVAPETYKWMEGNIGPYGRQIDDVVESYINDVLKGDK